jgi:hypothetical protein
MAGRFQLRGTGLLIPKREQSWKNRAGTVAPTKDYFEALAALGHCPRTGNRVCRASPAPGNALRDAATLPQSGLSRAILALDHLLGLSNLPAASRDQREQAQTARLYSRVPSFLKECGSGRMAKMTLQHRPDLETLAAVIAHSQIVLRHTVACRRLPAGFEAVDAAILGWIADEARRVSRRFGRI